MTLNGNNHLSEVLRVSRRCLDQKQKSLRAADSKATHITWERQKHIHKHRLFEKYRFSVCSNNSKIYTFFENLKIFENVYVYVLVGLLNFQNNKFTMFLNCNVFKLCKQCGIFATCCIFAKNGIASTCCFLQYVAFVVAECCSCLQRFAAFCKNLQLMAKLCINCKNLADFDKYK